MAATIVKERSSKKEEIRVKREWKKLKISAQKVDAKVPKMAENGCERGQPTKRKVGFKILANRTAKQRQVWLQINGEAAKSGEKESKQAKKSKVKTSKTNR